MDNFRKFSHIKKQYIDNNEKVAKRIESTFIGALVRIEQHFGFLWNHGEEYENLTPNEKKWRNIWNKCRKSILDHGNEQIYLYLQKSRRKNNE